MLANQAIGLLSHLMQCLAERLQVPGVIPREPKRTIPGRLVDGRSRRKVERSQSWSVRFNKQEEQAKQWACVTPMLRRKNLKKAVTFLRVNGHCPSPALISEFIFRNADVDREDLGDFLGRPFIKNVLTREEMDTLREAYISRMAFSGLTIDQAMREFFINGGFKLPAESQVLRFATP